MLKRVVHLIPLLAGLAVAGIVFIAYRTAQENHSWKLHVRVEQALAAVKGQMELEFASSAQLVGAVVAALKATPDMNRTQFRNLAKTLRAEHPAVRSIQLSLADAPFPRPPFTPRHPAPGKRATSRPFRRTPAIRAGPT